MSDINITDTLAQSIINIIKKGDIFAKIKRMEKLVYGCGVLLTIFGCSILTNCVWNTQLILDNKLHQDKHLQKMQYKVDRLIEINHKLLILVEQQYYYQYDKDIPKLIDEKILDTSTISSITLVDLPDKSTKWFFW